MKHAQRTAVTLLLCLCPMLLWAQDPLLPPDGTPITTVQQWEETQRPQLQHPLMEHIYGHMPPPPQWRSVETHRMRLTQRNILYKEVALHLFKDGKPTRTIHLSIFIPLQATGPVPVILSLNKCGNHTVSDLAEVSIFSENILHPKCIEWMNDAGGKLEDLRGHDTDFWTIDTLMRRGYAFATFHDSDIAADVNSLEQDIFPFYPELAAPNGWKLVSAWAWGLHRAVDYLLTDKDMDAKRIILFGHSRRGKAALLAAALDQRVAMVVPHQSGTGGMALGKKLPMESIRRITSTFPYWFNENFKRHGKRPKAMPVDQHHLVALVAPRPVLETVGTWDVWSSYRLSLKTMRLASPVYDLYGQNGLLGNGKLSKRKDFAQKPIGNLLQIRRPYFHTMNGDYWTYILDFADLKLKGEGMK